MTAVPTGQMTQSQQQTLKRVSEFRKKLKGVRLDSFLAAMIDEYVFMDRERFFTSARRWELDLRIAETWTEYELCKNRSKVYWEASNFEKFHHYETRANRAWNRWTKLHDALMKTYQTSTPEPVFRRAQAHSKS